MRPAEAVHAPFPQPAQSCSEDESAIVVAANRLTEVEDDDDEDIVRLPTLAELRAVLVDVLGEMGVAMRTGVADV